MRRYGTGYGVLLGVAMAVMSAIPAAAQEVTWMHRMAASFFSFGNAATVDGDGNMYIAGYFGGTLDFGGKTLDGAGFGDLYIAKYDTDRQLEWVRHGTSPGWNGGRGIAVGADGSVFVAGRIEETTTFDSQTAPSMGENDMVIARYSADGAIRWVRSGGGAGMDWANGVAVDASGNSYVVGYYSGGATFGSHSLIAEGDHDIFVAAYDPNGTLRWIRSAGGSGVDEGYGVAVDSDGNVYVTGIVTGTAGFGAVSYAASGETGFVAKYRADGTIEWVKGGGTASSIESISINGDDEIVVAGSFSGTATFGATAVTSMGLTDVFVARYTTAGTPTAAWRYGGTGRDGVAGFGQSVEVVAAADGGFFLTAGYQNELTLGATTLTSRGKTDIFVARMLANGEPRWGISGGGIEDDNYVSLGADPQGNAYLLGNYFSPVFQMGPTSLTRYNSVDLVMAKIDGSSATGVPMVEATRQTIDIGDVVTGTDEEASVVISAGSNVPLTVTGVRFEDPASVDDGFTIESTPGTFPAELYGSSDLTVTVEFAPATPGEATAVLLVETNDPATPSLRIPVEGNGIDGSMIPRAVVSTDRIDITSAPIGVITERSFTVAAGTQAGLTLEMIEFEDPGSEDDGFTFVGPATYPRTLAAGESVEVKVRFTPEDEGTYGARLIVTTNDADAPYRNVDIAATATEAPMASISTTGLSFGTVDVGSTARQSFTITSLSGSPLSIERIALSANLADGPYTIIAPAPGTTYPLSLAGGTEMTVTVEFGPTAAGAVEGGLMIATNDPSLMESTVTLQGSGRVVTSGVDDDAADASLGAVRVAPNPLRGEGEIVIDIPQTGEIAVELYDIGGRLIDEIFNGKHDGGERRIVIDARGMTPGVYICVVTIEGMSYHRVVTID